MATVPEYVPSATTLPAQDENEHALSQGSEQNIKVYGRARRGIPCGCGRGFGFGGRRRHL